MFGAADPEPGEKKAEKLLDNIVWLSAMTKPVHQGGNRELIVQEYLKYQGAPDHIKSLVADGATGYGSDWVPQTWLTRWYEYIQAALVLGGVFDVLPMAGKKVELPRFGGIPESYTGAEPVTVSEDTTFASAAAIEFNAIPIKVYRNMSLELSIDAIIPAMGILQMKLAQGVAYGVERAIVDGDAITVANTTRSHDAYTTGRNAVGGCYTYWNGLRQQALTASPTANHDLSTFNIDNLVGLPKSMGIYAQNSLVNDLRWLVPQSVFWGSMFTLKDSSGNPAFLPALSGYAQSPIVVGKEALGLFMGIPVIASALMRTDLNASGVYDGSTTTKTDVLLFNRSAWMLGVQTAAAIYSLFLPVSTSWDIVAIAHYSFRHVETTYAASSAMGYNITS
jgi:HK97 family phage major capsid protein